MKNDFEQLSLKNEFDNIKIEILNSLIHIVNKDKRETDVEFLIDLKLLIDTIEDIIYYYNEDYEIDLFQELKHKLEMMGVFKND